LSWSIGQKILTLDRLAQLSLVQVWVWKIFLKCQIIFPSGLKKLLWVRSKSTRVKGRSASYLLRVKSNLGSGPISSLETYLWFKVTQRLKLWLTNCSCQVAYQGRNWVLMGGLRQATFFQVIGRLLKNWTTLSISLSSDALHTQYLQSWMNERRAN